MPGARLPPFVLSGAVPQKKLMEKLQTWRIVPCRNSAYSHEQGNNDKPAHIAAAVAEVEAALVAASALDEQDAASAATAKANEQGSVGGPKPTPAGISATVSCSALEQSVLLSFRVRVSYELVPVRCILFHARTLKKYCVVFGPSNNTVLDHLTLNLST